MTDILAQELLFAARENDGFFTLYLTDGSSLRARPAGLGRDGRRLRLLYPDGGRGSLSVNRLDGFSPGEESMLSMLNA